MNTKARWSSSDRPKRGHSASTSQSSLVTLQTEDSGWAEMKIDQPASPVSWLDSSRNLSFVSLALHGTLVALHLILILVWARSWEHNATFALQYQKAVSFMITFTTTTFGTIYAAALVFVSQILFTRRSLRRNQTLTATHDSLAAWTGVGSALARVWHQKAVPASIPAVLSAFAYLANILVLHVTTPALLSTEAFNATRLTPITTQGLPSLQSTGTDTFNNSAGSFTYNLSDPEQTVNLVYQEGRGSLAFLPYLTSVKTIGLEGNTLYDTLDSDVGTGNVTVNATSFQMACGYLSDVDLSWNDTLEIWTVNASGLTYTLPGPYSGIISTLDDADPVFFRPDIVFYSTFPILDSDNDTGPVFNLTYSVPKLPNLTLQFLRCEQSIVSQAAIVDAHSGEILSLAADIQSVASTWMPFAGNGSVNVMLDPSPQSPIALWQGVYSLMPSSNTAQSNGASFLTIGDMQLLLQLGFIGTGTLNTNTTLHAFENALAGLSASMFWILGHISPTVLLSEATAGAPNGTVLLQGSVTVTEMTVEIRLSLNILAIAGGLAASLALILLAFQSFDFNKKQQGCQSGPSIDGTGLLHVIWLYRNHPGLEPLLEQVAYPSHLNLRRAGMIRMRLDDNVTHG